MSDQHDIDAMSTASCSPATFSLDGEEVEFQAGETILLAATRHGRYIPHLCWHPEFAPQGSCRLCTGEGQRPLRCRLHRATGGRAAGGKRHRGD
ncbi:MAG: 2Fe-2S iron-sulfur cluster-binding protein [Porticoccaceae bacterium]